MAAAEMKPVWRLIQYTTVWPALVFLALGGIGAGLMWVTMCAKDKAEGK